MIAVLGVGRGVATRLATALAAFATVEVLLFAIMSTTANHGLRLSDISSTVLVAIPFAAVGAMIVRRDRTHTLGWTFVALGQLCGLNALGFAWGERGLAGHALAVWLGAYLWIPALLLQTAILILYFPSGRLPSPRWRPVAIVAWSTVGVGTLGAISSDGPLRDADPDVRNPFAVAAFDDAAALVVFGVIFATAVACFIVGLVGAIMRTRASSERRVAIYWGIGSFAVTVVGTVIGGVPNLIGALAIPLGLGMATLRYGLYRGDQFTGRTAIHSVVTVTMVSVLAVTAGLLAEAIGGSGLAAILAAVVIAVLLVPTQRWVGDLLDRLFYGQRLAPYLALTRLGRRLAETPASDEVPERLVAAVAESLRLPYASITLADDAEPSAVSGSRPARCERLPLTYCGERIGVLEVGLRPGERSLELDEETLLEDLARQAGAAIGAVVFMRDLQRSRERLLVTREQERQRLREDLHDGLGPTLAGVALGLESARRQMAGGAVASELADLSSDVELALDDLKRIVAELRPAALDELGLVDALKQYAQALDASSPMRVSVRMGGRLPDLPTSHELAAYFIAREAMNNAVRHSAGTSCEVSVRWADGLHVRVRDDGAGLPAEPRPGVGLDSMRRRARALGGECRVGPPQRGGGTEVTLWLPTTS